MLCKRGFAKPLKGRIFDAYIYPALTYGLETVPLTQNQQWQVEMAETKMLRGALEVKRLDFRTNDSVRAEIEVTQLSRKLRRKRLQWLGHVQRRDDDYMGKRALALHVEGTRRKGKPKMTLPHMIKADIRALRIEGGGVCPQCET